MKLKTIITVVLLVFVAGSVVYLVVNEARSPEVAPAEAVSEETESEGAEIAVNEDLPEAAVAEGPAAQSLEKVVVYYFHGTARCATCKKFEAFANEAIKGRFADELAAGRLEWQVVNVEESDNKHFVSDYELYTRSIVVVKMRDGRQVAWKNLKRIWELVRDKVVFVKYVQDEVRAYLEAE